MAQAVQIFIAYARKDSALLDEFRVHLRPLERADKLRIWYDGLIEPGAEWEASIKQNLHAADIILLLVSADAIASDYFYDKEVADALERHRQGSARVVPMIVRPCPWKTTPLADLQALPKDGKPVTTWSNPDEAYTYAAEALWDMVHNILQLREEKSEAARREKEAAEETRLAAQKAKEAEARKAEQERLQRAEEEKRRKEAEAANALKAEQDRLRRVAEEKQRKEAEARQKARQKAYTDLISLAHAQQASGQWAEALKTWQEALGNYEPGFPENPTALKHCINECDKKLQLQAECKKHIENAKKYLEQKEWSHAITAAKAALLITPDDYTALHLLKNAEKGSSNESKAKHAEQERLKTLRAEEKRREADTQQAEYRSHIEKAQKYLSSKEWHLVEGPAKAALKIIPDDAVAQSMLGVAEYEIAMKIAQEYFRERKWVLTQIFAERALNHFPSSSDAKTLLQQAGKAEKNWRKLKIGAVLLAIIISSLTIRYMVIIGSDNSNDNAKIEQTLVPSKQNLETNMVLLSGGTFSMGCTSEQKDCSADEKPVTRVTVDDFYMGKYEVTFDEYDAFCESTGREKPSDEGWGRGQRPVINISWNDAVAFCNWHSEQANLTKVYTISGDKVTADWSANGYRLPTEAEWEYAARGGGKAVLFGNGKNVADPQEINFDASAAYKKSYSVVGEYRQKTVPVGSLNSPNAMGLHDMSGNVYEWCWDWKAPYPGGSKNNYRGPASGSYRVLRGGSWLNNPQYVRVAFRDGNTPDNRNAVIGFRLSRTP